MSWFLILVGCVVALALIHVALHIYYSNGVSRVDQIKIQMAHLEPISYMPPRNRPKTETKPIDFNISFPFLNEFAIELYQVIRLFRQVILSIITPTLYAFVG